MDLDVNADVARLKNVLAKMRNGSADGENNVKQMNADKPLHQWRLRELSPR